ncbi:MAG: 2-amino-4-hydroxy-6-hydroxymethyldihydropteridine diphosphokinase [Bacteroidales bacterium]|nr:2-amino-4-hydroxy-6-hydroxymethyldihydropteridine diphosphokinase [Bacteroidales bacterium]
MREVFLLLGSNRGNRHELLYKAAAMIAAEAGTVLNLSSIYETEPWGFTDPIPFLNQALEIETELSPEKLLETLLLIEKKLGRIREENPVNFPSPATERPAYIGRTIDIDILLYGNKLILSDSLTIPHPRLHERFFALQPLAEIAPDFVHPAIRKDIKTLLKMTIDY